MYARHRPECRNVHSSACRPQHPAAAPRRRSGHHPQSRPAPPNAATATLVHTPAIHHAKRAAPVRQATLSAVMRIQSMMIAKLFGVALAFHGAVAAAAGARAFALFFGPDQTSDGQSDYRYEAKRYDDRSHVFSEPG